MRNFLAISACLLLVSCAFQTLDKGLPRLTGRNIDFAISYLGIPDFQQEIAGRKVYTWGVSNTFTTVTPVTNYNSGNIYGSAGSARYSGTTTSYIPQTHNYNCQIKVITDKKNKIINSQYAGNVGGCSAFESRVNALIQATNPPEQQ